MKRSRLLVALLLVAAAIGLGVYENRIVAQQREQLAAQSRRLETARRELAEWQLRQRQVTQDLALARDAAAAGPDIGNAATNDAARAGEIATWLGRVKKLRQLFASRPDQQIPELALLSDLDWLSVARRLKFETETDIRQAFAEARSSAKSRFASKLSLALRSFTAANDGMIPTDLMQLLPHFETPVDPAIFPRYEIRQSGKASAANPRLSAIVERTPIDADYDSRTRLQATGGFGANSPWNSSDLADAVIDAQARFAAANNNQRPKTEAELIPFIESPVARGVMTAMADYQKAHPDKDTKSIADVLPYATDPAVRAELERMIRAKDASSASSR